MSFKWVGVLTLQDNCPFVNILGSLSCSLSKPLLEKIWPFIYLGTSVRTAGASWKTQTWVHPGCWDSAQDGPLLPASWPPGKEGQRGKQEAKCWCKAGGGEAVAQRTATPGRCEGPPTVAQPTKRALNALSVALFPQLEKG